MTIRRLEPKTAWLAVLGQLQMQLSRSVYDTYVDGAYFIDSVDGVFTIGTPNSYSRDWLTERLYDEIVLALSDMCAEPVEVEFIVQPKTAKPARFGPLLQTPPPAYDDAPARVATLSAPPVEHKVRFGQGQTLNQDYHFGNFVVGDSNQLAHAAACAVAEAPTRAYSPLFIYSGVGLGKTHLLHAIGNVCAADGLHVLYVTGETFTNDLIRAIRTRQTDAFREHYRSVDVLLVDDVQFISGKESTQAEFFHTFNDLHNQNCQIVLTADRRPRDMANLEDRLLSRFEWGLTVDIQRPQFETRLAILMEKAWEQGIDLPHSVADLIANRVRESVRELEGALHQVLAQVALTRRSLDRDFAEAVLNDRDVDFRQTANLNIFDVFETTAEFHQLTLDDLMSKQRSKDIANARHVAIYLAREELNATLPEIGRALGGRTHSTIINSYNKVVDRLESDPDFRHNLATLRKQLYQNA